MRGNTAWDTVEDSMETKDSLSEMAQYMPLDRHSADRSFGVLAQSIMSNKVGPKHAIETVRLESIERAQT